MSYQVEIVPSGHRFEAQAGESLLDAALRAGLNIKYNCSSGSCGECRARLLQGQLQRHRHGDFTLSAAEQAQGEFFLCTQAAASDLKIEAFEAGSSDDIPYQQLQARVRGLQAVGDSMLLLTLRTPRSQTLRFLAGQHVHLRPLGGGEGADLALAGCPCNGMELQFHIAREPSSPFIEYLFHELSRGDALYVEGPYGDFTLDEGSGRPLLFIAEGVGFAATKSLVEHELALDSGRGVELWWLEGGNGRYLDNLCRSWDDVVDGLHYRPMPCLADLEAAITALDQPSDYDIYLTLSEASLAVVRPRLGEVGADTSRVFHSRLRHSER